MLYKKHDNNSTAVVVLKREINTERVLLMFFFKIEAQTRNNPTNVNAVTILFRLLNMSSRLGVI